VELGHLRWTRLGARHAKARGVAIGLGLLGATVVLALPPSGHAAAARGTGTAAAKADAARDAARLLGRLRLPAGATESNGPPAGAGSALVSPSIAPATPDLATRVAYWSVPETPTAVLAFVAAHPPAGSRKYVSGTSGLYGQVTARMLGFNFKATRVLGLRALGITVVATSPTTSAVLAEAADVWLIARPSSERVPAAAEVIDVLISQQSLGGGGGPASRRLTVTAPTKVARLIAAVNALPASQPGVENCPLDNGSGVTMDFRATPRGPQLAVVRADSSGCGGVTLTLGGRAQPPLSGGPGLTTSVGRILGVPVPAG
jgi:hypothetical protein